MLRPPSALAALLFVAAFLGSTRAQDPPEAQKPPKRTDLPADDAIWGYGWIGGEYPVGGPPPAASPIVPLDWLVVPRAAGDGVAELLARIGDPTGCGPAAGDRIAGSPVEGAKWEARRRDSLKDVSCAFARIECDHEEVRMARLSGAALLFVNGTGFVGDAEQRGFGGVPIALRKGANDLYVHGIGSAFDLELWSPVTRTVLGTWDVGWPDDMKLDVDLAFPVFNASRAAVAGLHVHYGHACVEGGSSKPRLTDWRDGGQMLPLGLRVGASIFLNWMGGDVDSVSMDKPLVAPVCVWSDEDGNADRQLLRWAGGAGPRASERTVKALVATPLLRLDANPLLVYGAQGSLERARFDQESIWYRAGYVPEAIDGAGLLNLPPETQPDTINWHIRKADNASRYVLYGNFDTNDAWPRFVATDHRIQVHAGRLSVDGKVFEGDDICGWFMLKTAEYEDVLVIADTGARGVRLGYLVQPLLSDANELEYAFWDARGPNGGPRLFQSAKRNR